MKRIIFLIFVLFITLISVNTHASSFKFVWENTLVEVPFGDSVDKYKEIPKAHLYVDSIEKPDANITYNRDGDWLCYLRDVNTNVLKDYYVWYKAYENDVYRPGTCTDYKCKIQFKIVDKEAPKITILNQEINLNSGTTDFDPLSNVTITDNCTKDLKISYSPKFSELGNGSHTIKITAADESGNITEASFKLNIIDSTLPYFVKLKSDQLIFDVGSTASLEGYYEAYDDVDGNITGKINYPTIKTDKPGDYTYELKVSDSSGNVATEEVNVTIKDLTIPTIELSKETDILSYDINLNTFNYLKYVSNITDNDTINYNNLTYETNLINKVGSYYIRFKYTDGTNLVYKDLIIKLVSYKKPNVETDMVPLVVGNYVDLKDYIKVTDPSDENINLSIIIDDDNVNYYKEGSYIASVYAINSSGISTEEDVEVKILSQKNYNKLMGIEEKNDFSTYLIYILAGVIALMLVGFTLVIILLKKKKTV